VATDVEPGAEPEVEVFDDPEFATVTVTPAMMATAAAPMTTPRCHRSARRPAGRFIRAEGSSGPPSPVVSPPTDPEGSLVLGWPGSWPTSDPAPVTSGSVTVSLQLATTNVPTMPFWACPGTAHRY